MQNVLDLKSAKENLEKIVHLSSFKDKFFWFWNQCELDPPDLESAKNIHKILDSQHINHAVCIKLKKEIETAIKNTKNKQFKNMLVLFLKYI